MAKWEEYLEEGHLEKILKLVKKELKEVKSGKNPPENLALEDE